MDQKGNIVKWGYELLWFYHSCKLIYIHYHYHYPFRCHYHR